MTERSCIFKYQSSTGSTYFNVRTKRITLGCQLDRAGTYIWEILVPSVVRFVRTLSYVEPVELWYLKMQDITVILQYVCFSNVLNNRWLPWFISVNCWYVVSIVQVSDWVFEASWVDIIAAQ